MWRVKTILSPFFATAFTLRHHRNSEIVHGPELLRRTSSLPLDEGLPAAERLADLREMGLTHQESIVYAVLLSMGPSHARRVSERANLPREDSYRVLKHLEEKGLVEVVLGKTSVFVAVDPRVAVRSFVSKVVTRSEELTQKAYDLGVWLETIKDTVPRDDDGVTLSNPSVRVFSGNQVFSELERMIREGRAQYSGLVSPVSFGSFLGSRFLESLVSASKRGVDVRVITTVTDQTSESVRRYSRILPIRHHPSINHGIRFSVVDGTKAILALAEPGRNAGEARVLYSSIPTLTRGLMFRFEEMWKESRPIIQPVRRARKQAVGFT